MSDLEDGVPVVKKRFNYLRQPHYTNLELALNSVLLALNEHCAYLVGSVFEGPDYNDIDVVILMEDEKYDALFGKSGSSNAPFVKWFNHASSTQLGLMTGLPIDFRVQRMSNANKQYGGPKNIRDPIGINGNGPDFDPAWKRLGEPE